MDTLLPWKQIEKKMGRFAGLRLSEALPDETTMLKLRHLLEKHKLGKALFARINNHLSQTDLALKEGTIVAATIIHTPS